MSGRHLFRELTAGFSLERCQRIKAMKEELLAEMPLDDLRRSRSHTQPSLDKSSGVITCF